VGKECLDELNRLLLIPGFDHLADAIDSCVRCDPRSLRIARPLEAFLTRFDGCVRHRDTGRLSFGEQVLSHAACQLAPQAPCQFRLLAGELSIDLMLDGLYKAGHLAECVVIEWFPFLAYAT
jgi:hypothetical protein